MCRPDAKCWSSCNYLCCRPNILRMDVTIRKIRHSNKLYTIIISPLQLKDTMPALVEFGMYSKFL